MGENPELVGQYRGGKGQLHAFFVGQVMKKSKGKADPQLVNHVLEKQLTE